MLCFRTFDNVALFMGVVVNLADFEEYDPIVALSLFLVVGNL